MQNIIIPINSEELMIKVSSLPRVPIKLIEPLLINGINLKPNLYYACYADAAANQYMLGTEIGFANKGKMLLALIRENLENGLTKKEISRICDLWGHPILLPSMFDKLALLSADKISTEYESIK